VVPNSYNVQLLHELRKSFFLLYWCRWRKSWAATCWRWQCCSQWSTWTWRSSIIINFILLFLFLWLFTLTVNAKCRPYCFVPLCSQSHRSHSCSRNYERTRTHPTFSPVSRCLPLTRQNL